jgi:hypothetical protein
MRIYKVKTVQAHYVPPSVYYPDLEFDEDDNLVIDNLLDPSLHNNPEVVEHGDAEGFEGSSNLPDGATAQNNYREIKMYRCKFCRARVSEGDLDIHDCDA